MQKKEIYITKKLDWIDALRGLAILLVITVHSNQYSKFLIPDIVINGVINQGAIGVQLFFIASACTLFLSFKNRQNKEAFPIRNFFIRRFFRIAPMYYLGIIYYLVQDGLGARYWLGNETHITGFNILSNFTFLAGFNPYWITSIVPGSWTIQVEMTFYFILPFLFFKIRNSNQALNFFMISLFIKAFLAFILMKIAPIGSDWLWGGYLFFYLPSQLPVFALGILTYFFIFENQGVNNFSGKSLLVLSGIVLTLVLRSQIFLPNHILAGITFAILAIALSKYPFKLFVNPIIIYIGKISFSMYLVHFAVLHWLTYFSLIDYFSNTILNYISRFLVVTLLTVLLSSFFYTFIEIRFQKLGKIIITRFEDIYQGSAIQLK